MLCVARPCMVEEDAHDETLRKPRGGVTGVELRRERSVARRHAPRSWANNALFRVFLHRCHRPTVVPPMSPRRPARLVCSDCGASMVQSSMLVALDLVLLFIDAVTRRQRCIRGGWLHKRMSFRRLAS